MRKFLRIYSEVTGFIGLCIAIFAMIRIDLIISDLAPNEKRLVFDHPVFPWYGLITINGLVWYCVAPFFIPEKGKYTTQYLLRALSSLCLQAGGNLLFAQRLFGTSPAWWMSMIGIGLVLCVFAFDTKKE